MVRVARFAVSCAVCLLLAAVPAVADSITISGGSLDMHGTYGGVSLGGGNGFTLQSGVDITGGVFEPWDQCSATACRPGTSLSLDAFWSSSDLPSIVTYNGVTYPRVGDLALDANAWVRFTGSAIVPPLNTNGIAFVQAPFAFTGAFTNTGVDVNLSGTGIASLWFTPEFDGKSWVYSKARYDFAVTPEPAPIFLFGAGLLVVAALMRRHSASQRH